MFSSEDETGVKPTIIINNVYQELYWPNVADEKNITN